jgi:hypothetical protein
MSDLNEATLKRTRARMEIKYSLLFHYCNSKSWNWIITNILRIFYSSGSIMNLISLCYYCSQLFKFWNIFMLLIYFLYHVHVFIFFIFTPTSVSLSVCKRILCVLFYDIYILTQKFVSRINRCLILFSSPSRFSWTFEVEYFTAKWTRFSENL